MQARYNQWRKYTLHTSDYHVELPDTVTLELTDEEKEIFDFLLLVCKKYNLETTMRVAGGWVRNKLLDIPCADIDIVIDNMSGLQFATYIMKYRDEMDVQNIKQAGVIPARPEQAKHLEVATMHIFKQDIDFANLRNETPDEMGTPMSDAYLRESTINSLFYNINENKIEDFTGGINDLKEGRIKAPQEARPSFFYDPNRIVRLARFASHFNMLIDHDLFEAAKEKDVQEVLYNKISKERFGAEISKLLKGPDPSGGLAILNELTVLHLIFRAKSGVKPFEETPIQWEEIAWDNALNGIKIIYEHIKNESNRERMSVMFAILFLYADNFDVEKGCTEVITNYLKISQQLGVETALLMKSVREVRDWLNVDDYTRFIAENRVKVSKWLRNIGYRYKIALLLADLLNIQEKRENRIQNAFKFAEAIENFEDSFVTNTIEMKPLMNGTEIAQQLNIKPSRLIATILSEITDWQLSIPHAQRTRDAAVQWLHTERYQSNVTSINMIL